MSTQISIEYVDDFIPFYETATTLETFAWLTLNGEIIAGSQTVAQPLTPPQTGDILTDVTQAIVDVLEFLTGDVADTSYVPLGSFVNPATFGVGSLPYGNNERNRPLVAVAAQTNYDWGALAIPIRDAETPFVWHFSFKATSDTSDQVSPAFESVKAYNNATASNPVLMVLELNSQ